MKASEIRQTFLDYFKNKGHKIVPSAPIVVKDDPTLMFTNAGMNQFKDFFLGNQTPDIPRIADTQKCLRVSGKHNDLEEVGIDSYHQTMFEMLGNWSFGDYFKKEAIEWAWDLLTNHYKIDKDRLYITIFEGDEEDNLEEDKEAIEFWKTWVNEDRILPFDRKDNFWEMGETGPCGPCSEIHVDIRPEEERQKIDGKTLVNQDHPQVVEIWNLVFIQFNRKANGQLENLPAKHIDTGMGFERLCMVIQSKITNYATDVFMPFINMVEDITDKKYTFSYEENAKSDIAMRVVVDHIRAVCFAIADGQLPANNGAGYVIKRILRRAVRYYYTFLDQKEPLLFRLVPTLAHSFKDTFPELDAQKDFVSKIVLEEEKKFLKTLASGLRRLEQLELKNNQLDGKVAFELFDTYGFPIDLTQLIVSEKGASVDMGGFKAALEKQRKGSEADAERSVGDWIEVNGDLSTSFVGYDLLESEAHVIKYRTVKLKDKDQYQLVLDTTPFYAEGGGQVGDKGLLFFGEEKIPVLDTKKENDLFIHIVKKFPSNFDQTVKAQVNGVKRAATENNHTATHLVHAALRQVLGTHVEQKGSLLNDQYLRFDFSHFAKMSEEEIQQVEDIVNEKIRANIPLTEHRSIGIEEAKAAGAMMLFGEKYGDNVRMITFDPSYSNELCGGCHVNATGQLGLFKLTSESSIQAGVRRIEALTGKAAWAYFNDALNTVKEIGTRFKNPQNVVAQVDQLQEENKQLKKELDKFVAMQAQITKKELKDQIQVINGINFIGAKVDLKSMDAIKQLSFELRNEVDNLFLVLGAEINNKANLAVAISENLTTEKSLNAGSIIRDLAKNIQGGGGGQAFYATAGGKNAAGIPKAIEQAKTIFS